MMTERLLTKTYSAAFQMPLMSSRKRTNFLSASQKRGLSIALPDLLRSTGRTGNKGEIMHDRFYTYEEKARNRRVLYGVLTALLVVAVVLKWAQGVA